MVLQMTGDLVLRGERAGAAEDDAEASDDRHFGGNTGKLATLGEIAHQPLRQS